MTAKEKLAYSATKRYEKQVQTGVACFFMSLFIYAGSMQYVTVNLLAGIKNTRLYHLYCVKDVSITAAPHGIPELISGAIVVGLHLWKRNTLVSIVAGTVVYMLLIQCIF